MLHIEHCFGRGRVGSGVDIEHLGLQAFNHIESNSFLRRIAENIPHFEAQTVLAIGKIAERVVDGAGISVGVEHGSVIEVDVAVSHLLVELEGDVVTYATGREVDAVLIKNVSQHERRLVDVIAIGKRFGVEGKHANLRTLRIIFYGFVVAIDIELLIRAHSFLMSGFVVGIKHDASRTVVVV